MIAVSSFRLAILIVVFSFFTCSAVNLMSRKSFGISQIIILLFILIRVFACEIENLAPLLVDGITFMFSTLKLNSDSKVLLATLSTINGVFLESMCSGSELFGTASERITV